VSTYLWEIFKCGERDDVSVSVQDGYGEVGGFDQLQDPWVRIHSVVRVVLSDFNQIDDLVAVVRVSSPKNDTIVIKFFNVHLVHHGLRSYKLTLLMIFLKSETPIIRIYN